MVSPSVMFLIRPKCIFFLLSIFFLSFSVVFGQPSATHIPSEPQQSASLDKLQTALNEINGLVDRGDLLDAKARYRALLEGNLSGSERSSVEEALYKLNIRILFSPTPTPDSFLYEVERGDSLYKIAKRYNTTVEFIKRSNYVEKDIIRPGMKLKISKATYSITVDVSDNKLILWSGGERFKTYPVATGKKGHETPVGAFTIENKLENPTWYKTGAVVPPGSPDNILGTRWLGFSLEGYGIHGTTLPETVGTDASDGCIRMHNHDVEELYSIVPLKTKVTVMD